MLIFSLSYKYIGVNKMALTQTQVSELFVAVFGRAGEGSGLTFFGGYASQADAANAMFNTAGTTVVTDYFGVTNFSSDASITKVIEVIFKNALGTSDLTDANGVAAVAHFLNVAKTTSIGEMVSQLVTSAQLSVHQETPTAKIAQDTFLNMVEIANYVAEKIAEWTGNFSDTDIANGFLSLVDDTAASVITAKAAVDTFAGSIEATFTLTTDMDILPPVSIELTGVAENIAEI